MPEEGAPCRDFVRGVCSRGDNCKYFHPEHTEPAEVKTKLPICKDFQNKGCDRRKCKFLHITQEEEGVYNSTGELPAHGGRPEVVSRPSSMANVCKDFLNGKCDRGPRCKFMHVPESDIHGGGDVGGMYGKRSRMDGFYDQIGGGRSGAIIEENEVLRHKISDLQREIVNLKEMNNTLYDQNARYCSQLQKAGVPATASTTQANTINSNPVTYPAQFNQAVFPVKAAVIPMGTTGMSGVGSNSAYSYLHY